MSHDQSITPEDLRQWIRYDPETGEFFWKVDRGWTTKAGSAAGTLTPDGYIKVKVKGKQLYAHRVAWAIHYGRWPADQLDHINGDRTDNRIANLREATNQDNSRNAKKRADNTSGVTGVRWDAYEERWTAEIGNTRPGTRRRRRFRAFEEAVACRKAFEAEENYSPLHGEDELTRWLLA